MLFRSVSQSRYGSASRYPDFYSNTGYGSITGLKGINCTHDFFPYFEGISKSAYPDGAEQFDGTVRYRDKEMSIYDATQRQRYIERNIRQYKREASALKEAGFETPHETGLIRKWQSEMRELIDATGLKRNYFRESIHS